jgi:transcription elongation GreA/GreB family factor
MGELGALVQTETSTCFIAAAMGILSIENQKIAIISEQSPLAKALLKKKAGESIELAGKSNKILTIL